MSGSRSGLRPRSRFGRLLIGAAALTAVLPALTVLGTTSAQAGTPGQIGVGVTNLASANLARSACGANSIGGTGFDTSCTGNSGQPENWGADFVAWDWAQEGISTTGLLNTAGGSNPSLFAKYGGPNGSQHSSPLYVPRPGDAVVYDNPPDYVAIVTAVNADGSVATMDGDWGGEGPGASSVQSVILPSGQSSVGSAPTPMNGKTISSYVTPAPVAGESISLSPYGATSWTPSGSSTSRTDILAADPHGVLWDYSHTTGSPSLLGTVTQAEAGWTHYRKVGVADMNHDGYPDIIAIDTNTNVLQVFTGSANGFSANGIQLGTGWSTDFVPMSVVDYDHTGHYGIIADQLDTAVQYFYPGDLSGGVGARQQLGTGWTSNFTEVGSADLVGSGHKGTLTCRTDNNQMVYYAGDGTGGGGAVFAMANCAGRTVFGLADYFGDGHADLITRDDSTGVLSVTPTSLSSVSTVIAPGSAATKALTPFGTTTWTPPGTTTPRTDVYAADQNGNLQDYQESADGTLTTTPAVVATGWTHYRKVGVADMNHDGYPDMVVIDTNTNDLNVFTGTATGFTTTPVQLGNGWTSDFVPMSIVDYDHTGHFGVIADQLSNATQYFYPGDLSGGVGARAATGTGWTNAFTSVGSADFASAGHAGTLTCSSVDDSLRYYEGDGTGGGGGIDHLATGCGNDAFFGVTDYNGDGHPDIVARDNTTGNLIVATGDGNGGWSQNSATLLATTW